MDLYLIRHPETIAPKGTCYGRVDFPLKVAVRSTALQVLDFIPDSFPLMVASPLGRAKTLATDLIELIGAKNPKSPISLELDPRLQEMDFGDWDGILWNDLPKKDTMLWMSDFVNRKAPNGESFKDVVQRTDSFLEDWSLSGTKRKTWERENGTSLDHLVAVLHSGTIRAILCRLLSKPWDKAFEEEIPFGSVRKVSI